MPYFDVGKVTGGGSAPVDYTELIQAIRDKGGTVAEGEVTVLDLVIAVATIPDPGAAPECPMPGVPIGNIFKETVVFPKPLIIT